MQKKWENIHREALSRKSKYPRKEKKFMDIQIWDVMVSVWILPKQSLRYFEYLGTWFKHDYLRALIINGVWERFELAKLFDRLAPINNH